MVTCNKGHHSNMLSQLFCIFVTLSLCCAPLGATPTTPPATQAQSDSYTCTYCQKSFTRRSNLNRHIESVHHKRTHPCTQCTKVFKYAGSLKQHVRTAHEHHSHDCEQCGQKFISLRDLKVHVSAKHLGDVYPCQDCDKTFTRPRNLKEHRSSIHAGKTHTCPLCDKNYTYRRSLKLHCTRTHGVPLESLPPQASTECFPTTHVNPEISSCTDNAQIRAGEVPLDPPTENEPQDTPPDLEQDNTGCSQLAGILGQDFDDWIKSHLEQTLVTFTLDEEDLEPATKRPRLDP